MAEIKADSDTILVVKEHNISDQKLPKPKRVASVDIFRGLTVAVLKPFSFFFALLIGNVLKASIVFQVSIPNLKLLNTYPSL